ncbi:cell division topological specificity factor MinE [Helicobacter winghamensis]|uniref:Cell division topological specificity factor n=1 Tax=Helicobacter winghamensis TaxID=157268 RepID=A0A2N3PHK1_9HELI|nr:cell division topological specificity factor MinE [Helicobacter winghamensis]PKT75448.1 cell division topological specificity factor MinE [Helicobacter winghamensis]PKT79913.1 cell division topological specificity factor MinE [Helicobacter winghamensis]PKT79997.1 cell division topological specificity factor MinE [Helicobacter winghamensis]QOQ98329.1 cell division topological specificity factor MinE [Helicobacter winghamensis]
MSFLDIFKSKKNSAQEAKDRLTLILAHERAINVPYMDAMKQEILEVIKKYTKAQKIDIKTDSNQNFNTLEVEILLEK